MAKPEGLQAPLIPKGVQDPPALPAPPVPQALQASQQPAPYMPPLNWSHFKSEFSGKPDEDAQAHLLRINHWMDTHRFQDNDKVQRFCLTLIGEARLWQESLRPINVHWIE